MGKPKKEYTKAEVIDFVILALEEFEEKLDELIHEIVETIEALEEAKQKEK